MAGPFGRKGGRREPEDQLLWVVLCLLCSGDEIPALKEIESPLKKMTRDSNRYNSRSKSILLAQGWGARLSSLALFS